MSAVVVALSGDLDLAAVPAVRAAFGTALHAGPTSVEVRLDRVKFADSTGVRALVGCRRRAAAAGVECVLTGAGPQVLQAVRLFGAQAELDCLPAAVGRCAPRATG